jgi:outer membrane protein OmpA-like peptidoglycan-associated protein
MRTARRLVSLTSLLALLISAPAKADDTVTVEVMSTALVGQGRPRLIVRARQEVAGLLLELTRGDGGQLRRESGKLGAGAAKEFELEQPVGVAAWTGQLTVRARKGPGGEVPLAFETALLAPPKLTVDSQAVDLVARTVTLTIDRDAPLVRLVVLGDDGSTISATEETLTAARAGVPTTIAWKSASNARVLRIDVRATDRFGYYQDLELYPWSIEIPHEDVLFATGQAEVVPAEQPKLEAALAELKAALAKYGRFAKLGLFVEGHTDTVGEAGSNRKLSEARAQAIARWFAKRGAAVPISYTGLGEDRPLVPTADETDEPRNRRAAYIVAVEPPGGPRWTRLR